MKSPAPTITKDEIIAAQAKMITRLKTQLKTALDAVAEKHMKTAKEVVA